jgi:micrococcal nuclease
MNIDVHYYQCIIKRIVDGDTVEIDVDQGFGDWKHDPDPNEGGLVVRLAGIDAPESRSSDPTEKIFGLHSKEKLEEFLPQGTKCIYHSQQIKAGKYGRNIGDFMPIDAGANFPFQTACRMMLDLNLAIPYGLDKQAAKEAHEHNRSILLKKGEVKLPE